MKKHTRSENLPERSGILTRLYFLTILSTEGRYKSKYDIVSQCDCGNIHRSTRGHWGKGPVGGTKSCGCLPRIPKLARRKMEHPLFGIYTCMKSRCNNPNNEKYKNYGARGIKVCERWKEFWNFVEDMGERPPGYTIERDNVNGNYEPSNCRWSPHSEQAYNKTNTRWVVINGEKVSLAAMCRKYRMEIGTVLYRISRGIDPLTALTTPPKKYE